MHDKIRKGIAALLSAALVLCSMVTGIAPVQAAESGGEHETAYELADLELIDRAETATIDGNTISWTDQYGNVFYKIPQDVIDAGLIGFKCTGTTSAQVDLKIVNGSDIWGEALVNTYTTSFDNAIARIDASQREEATVISIMSCGGKDVAMQATIESIIFITDPVPAEDSGEEVKIEEKSYTLAGLGTPETSGVELLNPVLIHVNGYNGVDYVIPDEVKEAGLNSWSFRMLNDESVLEKIMIKSCYNEWSGDQTDGGASTIDVSQPDEVLYIQFAGRGNPADLIVKDVTFTTGTKVNNSSIEDDGVFKTTYTLTISGEEADNSQLEFHKIMNNDTTVKRADMLHFKETDGQVTYLIPDAVQNYDLHSVQVQATSVTSGGAISVALLTSDNKEVAGTDAEVAVPDGSTDSFQKVVIKNAGNADDTVVIDGLKFFVSEKKTSSGGSHYVPPVIGGGSVGGTTTETKPDGTKVETSTGKTEDATTTTVTETKTDGSVTETKTETKTDGSVTETKTETKSDGSTTESVKETAANGSAVENTVVKNASGEVVQTTKTTTREDGSVTEQTVIAATADTAEATLNIEKNNTGMITSATAAFDSTASGKAASLSGAAIERIIAAAGTNDVSVTMNVKNNAGNIKYMVKANTTDLQAGNKLYAYKLNSATGEYVMVNAKSYKVDVSGNVNVSMSSKGTYELLNTAAAKQVNKKIKATIIPKNDTKSVKKGNTAKFKLDGSANKDSIKSVNYLSAKKSVATVNKNGKITAKGKGTATIKAEVTLKNGAIKTIRMKVTVK